ncbi:MAG: hypothetical protein ACFFHV_15210 [Promethearchaeota archaeon]
MSSGLLKRRNKDFLKNCLSLEESLNLARRQVQKTNFKVITSLISNLFESKNKESYSGISNAIVSFLSLSNKIKKTDVCLTTKNIPFKELVPECKQILKQEFGDAIKNLKKE